MDQNINEFFAVPIGTEEVNTGLPDFKLFTSSTLKQRYLQALAKSSKTKHLTADIAEMVDKGLIVPAWMNKSVFSFIKFKVFGPKTGEEGKKHIFGFFEQKKSKIYILIDNTTTFGFTSIDMLATFTVHEAMHMSSKRLGSQFLKLFQPELNTYYSNFFKVYFSLKKDAKLKDVDKIIKYLHTKLETGQISNWKVLTDEYPNMIRKSLRKHSTLSDSAFDQMVKDYATALIVFLQNMGAFIKRRGEFAHLTGALYSAYKKTFGVSAENATLAIQELFAPSEVIAVWSEIKPSRKTQKALKMTVKKG